MGARDPLGLVSSLSCTCYPTCHMGFLKKIAVEGTTGPSQQLPARNPTSVVRPRRKAGPCSPGDPQQGQLGTGLTAPRGRRPPCAHGARCSAPASRGKPGARGQRLPKVRVRRPALRPRARSRRGSVVPGLRPGPARGHTWPSPRRLPNSPDAPFSP